MTKYTIDQFAEVLGAINGCGEHPVSFTVDQVDDVIFFAGFPGVNDCSSTCIAKLKDGSFLLLYEDSDYTGHG